MGKKEEIERALRLVRDSNGEPCNMGRWELIRLGLWTHRVQNLYSEVCGFRSTAAKVSECFDAFSKAVREAARL